MDGIHKVFFASKYYLLLFPHLSSYSCKIIIIICIRKTPTVLYAVVIIMEYMEEFGIRARFPLNT